MSKAFCLTKNYALKFKQGLKSGEIDPGQLSVMESSDRRAFLEKFVGKENALQTNALFESKLLLKNQKAGMIAWAKRVAGLKTPVRRDIFAKIEKLDKVLDPATEEAFMEDLVATRLNIAVSADEAKTIYAFSKRLQDAESKRDSKTREFKNEEERLDYGASKVAMNNYLNDIKFEAGRLSAKERLKPYNYVQNVTDVAGLAKSLKASFDNSALLRQGWKTMWTNPRIWGKNAAKSFVTFAKTLKNKEEVMDAVMADLVSRPNFERMERAKLAIGNIEEAYPTSLPEKVPVFGRVFRASQTSFESFQYRMRADIFDSYIHIAEKSGLDVDDGEFLAGIGKVINSLTGRGHLGALEPAANVVNNVFFSPRFVKSHLDVLTVHAMDRNISSFARKKAATNLMKVVMGNAALLILANAVYPDSVEEDPRSSNFGKIKIGNTRFDVSGGMASIATLAFRVARSSTKSSVTGKITPTNTGEVGSKTTLDLIYDFFENKYAPGTALVRDMLRGEDFDGNKPTVAGTLNNLFTPLPVANFIELRDDPNSAPILAALIADGLGVGTNTFGKSNTDWTRNPGKELTQFKEKVGETKFKEANEKFNKKYDAWFQDIARKPEYQNLSDEGKKAILEDAKEELRKTVLKEYKFKYKKEKTTTAQKTEKKVIKSLLP